MCVYSINNYAYRQHHGDCSHLYIYIYIYLYLYICRHIYVYLNNKKINNWDILQWNHFYLYVYIHVLPTCLHTIPTTNGGHCRAIT